MRFTQLVNFELSAYCPFATHHRAFCPSLLRSAQPGWEDTPELSTAQIIDTIFDLQPTGFRGYVGFHFYSDPMSSLTRMLSIIRTVRGPHPKQRFLLWTNAANWVEPIPEAAGAFDLIMLSLYDELPRKKKLRAMENAQKVCPNVKLHAQRDDERIDPSKRFVVPTCICLRPFTELTFDVHGDARMCCHDWHSGSIIGSLMDEDLKPILERWIAIRTTLFCDENQNPEMGKNAPELCRVCKFRYAYDGFDPQIMNDMQEYCLRMVHRPQMPGGA